MLVSGYPWRAEREQALGDAVPLGIKRFGVLTPTLAAQELVATPFQLLVACQLLNRTRREQAHMALWLLLELWPDPAGLATANPAELRHLIRACGFADRRTSLIIRMADEWLWNEWDPGGEADPRVQPMALPGVGNYAMDSWRVWVTRPMIEGSSDHVVDECVRWLRMEAPDRAW